MTSKRLLSTALNVITEMKSRSARLTNMWQNGGGTGNA